VIIFISCILILLGGYFIFSKYIVKLFGVNDKNITPALKINDGVDYYPLPTWKIYTIQFLNIAGLGPIFGAILGAMYGPAAYVWVVLGCVFMGATHDYFSGMISLRNNGASVPETVGKYLGDFVKNIMNVFTLLLLIFVGVAFVIGPAGLLSTILGGNFKIWVYLIFLYYLIATLLPIHQIIGKIYPFFGISLIVMAIMVGGYLLFGNIQLGELKFSSLKNLHHTPTQNILFPMLFIVISCGAISGFHSTQSPMMARCIKKESLGRSVFYGAMITEGIVACIWATVAINYFGNTEGLNQVFIEKGSNPAWIVNEVCNTWFGKTGAIIAIIGVIACPITTGDTAFRSARLTLAEMLKINQQKLQNRIFVCLPLFIIGFILSQLNFSTIWKYLGLSNQILATIFLWTIAVYLSANKKFHWVATLPAVFMTMVCSIYILVAPIKNGGLALDTSYSYWIAMIFSLIVFLIFMRKTSNKS